MALRPIRDGAESPSRPRPWGGVQSVYEDFRPMSELQQDEESDLLLLFLPGFMRQHLKVSTEGKNIVRVRGERLVAGNKWSRFQKDYQVPEHCDIRAIRARFEGGILTITMPWKKDIASASKATPPNIQVPPKSTSSTLENSAVHPEQQIRPPNAPLNPTPQRAVEEIHPKLLDPPKVHSPPSVLADKEFRAVEEIHPKVLGPPKVHSPPSVLADKELKNDAKTIIERQTKKGHQDEQSDRSRSPQAIIKPELAWKSTYDDGEKKEMISPDQSKGKQAKSEINDNLKELNDVKRNTEKIVNKEAQKGYHQDEQSDRSRSPKAIIKPVMMISPEDTKAKQGKSESKENLKEVINDYDKRSTEKTRKEGLATLAENLARKINEEKEKQSLQGRSAVVASSSSRDIYGVGSNYKKKAVKSLSELNEERQLLVNVGAAVLVIVALGTYIASTIGSDKAN